jgi:hypothetical protein
VGASGRPPRAGWQRVVVDLAVIDVDHVRAVAKRRLHEPESRSAGVRRLTVVASPEKPFGTLSLGATGKLYAGAARATTRAALSLAAAISEG